MTEAMARPMLELFYPELLQFSQPLSGQFAARTNFLRNLPFSTGYAVEIGLLLDTWKAVGLGAMAQVEIGTLHNAHQTLADLEPMAFQVGLGIALRLQDEGRLKGALPSSYAMPPDLPIKPPVEDS